MLFSKPSYCYFAPASGALMDWVDHLSPQIHIESHSIVNLCLAFHLETSLFTLYWASWKNLDGSQVSFLFTGNDRKHIPGLMSSSWVLEAELFLKLLEPSVGLVYLMCLMLALFNPDRVLAFLYCLFEVFFFILKQLMAGTDRFHCWPVGPALP